MVSVDGDKGMKNDDDDDESIDGGRCGAGGGLEKHDTNDNIAMALIRQVADDVGLRCGREEGVSNDNVDDTSGDSVEDMLKIKTIPQ